MYYTSVDIEGESPNSNLDHAISMIKELDSFCGTVENHSYAEGKTNKVDITNCFAISKYISK